MKYGQLNQANVGNTAESFFQVAVGDTATRPVDPTDGMIRYNVDHQVKNLGSFSGNGRFEVYTDNKWTPLISMIDFAKPSDLYSTENVTLKVLADMIRDFFVQGMGLVEVNQRSGAGNQIYQHKTYDPTQAKSSGYAFMPESRANIQGAPPAYTVQSGTTTSTGDHTNTIVQQIYPIFKPVVGNGMIHAINVTKGGSGYSETNPPKVQISTQGGDGGRIQVTVEKDSLKPEYGQIIDAQIAERGSGYSSSYTKVYLKGGGGKDGEITVGTSGGELDTVSIVNPGSEYQGNPVAQIADGGTRAYAEAVVQPGGGPVIRIDVLSRGVDYIHDNPSRFPVIEIVGGDGTGAEAAAEIGTGKVVDVEVLRGGANFVQADGVTPDPPAIVISGDGFGASYEVQSNQIDGGVVTGVTVVNMGQDYTYADAYVPPSDARSNSYIRYGTGTSVYFNFDLDLFTACGVPSGNRADYKIGLFSSMYKIITRYGHYAKGAYNRDYVQAVVLKPKWDTTAADPYSDTDYGVFRGEVRLEGVRSYYNASAGAVWFSTLTKFRNF